MSWSDTYISKKPYFCKYLPVEGGKKLFFTNANSLEGLISSEGLQDVLIEEKKLFLCSNKVKEGDKVYWFDPEPEGTSQFNTALKVSEDMIFMSELEASEIEAFPHEVISILGEISPEAIWVKEGDEFDEEEWRVAKNGADGKYVDYEKRTPIDEGYFIEIKCFTCKKFH